MKRFLISCVFLALGSMQVFGSQTQSSQFSVQTSKQKSALQVRMNARALARKSALPTRALTTNPGFARPATTKSISAKSRPHTSNPPVSQIGFVGATQIPAGGGSYFGAVSADFNGDGKQDVAALILNNDDATYSISTVLSNGNGTFQAAVLTPNPNGYWGDHIVTGDFNGDGKQDVIVVHTSGPSTFDVFLGNGDGSFSLQNLTPYAITANGLGGGVLTDINGDGKLDVVTIDNSTPANLVIVLGNGDGTFSSTPSVSALAGNQLNAIVFADFNGDGLIDFAAEDASLRQTVVYMGQANGSFLAGSPLTTSQNQQYGLCSTAAGDLTNDGKPEIVATDCEFNSLIVYVNNGDGTFQAGVPYAAGTDNSNSGTIADLYPEAVTIADVNGDGKNDLVSSNDDGSDITILLGNGDGTFTVPTVGFSTGGYPWTAALVADFNGDGVNDIIVPDDQFSLSYLQGYGDGTFRAALDYFAPIADNGWGYGLTIATGDFNGDGNPDFVVGECCDNSLGVTVFLSRGDGSLLPGVNYGSGGTIEGVTVADFNGDHHLDIAAVDYSNNIVQIFNGNGDGTFTVGNTYSTGGSDAWMIVSGDFNHDGYPDLAMGNWNSQNISVLLNDGTGAFLAATQYQLSGSGYSIATGDLNGDGFADLIVPQSNLGVDVFLGVGDGTFPSTPVTSLLGFANLTGISLGDLDGDGVLDLAVATGDWSLGHGVVVAKGVGDGTFTLPVLVPTTLQNPNLGQPYPYDVQIADLNGDGHQDLVAVNSDFSTVSLIYNTGTNAFTGQMYYDPVEYPGGAYAYSLALADVNGDGAVDVVTADDDFAGVSVLLNNSGPLTSNNLISSANPSVSGQSVTFTATLAPKVLGETLVPTGTVTFMDGSAALGTASLTGGVATFTGSLSVGSHSITAQYGGDTHFHASTSAALSQVVTAAPDYAVSTTASTATITAGSAATFTITLTPTGYNGTVNFSATGCPTKSTCTFNPTSVTLSGSSTSSTTFTVTTAGATASAVAPAGPNSKQSVPMLLASLSGLGIFGLVVAGAGSKKRSHRHMTIMLGILLVVMAVTLVGCGGSPSSSNTNTGGGSGTPSGNYTIPVTATGSGSNAPTHTMNLTVIVQ